MTAQPPTPEEKLFAVIQGAPASSPRPRKRSVDLTALRVRVQTVVSAVDLPQVNQALLGLIVLVGIWCVLNPFIARPQIDRLLSRVTQQIEPFIIAPPLEGLRSLEDYVQMMTAQDPFRIGDTGLGVPPSQPVVTQPPSQTAQALLGDLRLVGISQGATAESIAMIEQVSTRQTHFLKAGDRISQFTVQQILEDRVVLQYGTQTVELF